MLTIKKNRQGTVTVAGRTSQSRHPRRWHMDAGQHARGILFQNGRVVTRPVTRIVNA